MTDAQVTILGGGISGCLIACELADRGIPTLIVERRDVLLDGASRWNDGKIHLGYTFMGTPSLATASLMQKGAAVFLRTLDRVLGGPLAPEVFGDAVMYLVDVDSLVGPEVLWGRANAVASLLRDSMERLPGLKDYAGLDGSSGAARSGSLIERVDPELASVETGQGNVAAAWRTTEFHLATRRIADAIVSATTARGIPVVQARATKAVPEDRAWRVATADGAILRSAVVVNCTWENRVTIDRSVQPSADPVSIRYKIGLFGRGVGSLQALTPSTRILGRYGDIVTYRNGDAYLSWYPAGMLARSDDGVLPDVGAVDTRLVMDATLRGLRLPRAAIEEPRASWRLAGGHIVAHGYGDIDDLGSPLHERDRPSVQELRPGYITVDTGKYTLGPLMAERATEIVIRRLGQLRSPALITK